MRKRIYTLFAVALLGIVCLSCNSVNTITKLESKTYSPKTNLSEYKDCREALENFDFNYLKQVDSAKYLIVADVFESINTNKYNEAVALLNSEIKNESNEELHEIYISLLYQLYFTNYKWKDILEINDSSVDGTVYTAFANTYKDLPAETILYSNSGNKIPFETSDSGTPIVEVTINCYKAHFFVDTGAGMTVVSSDVAEECGLNSLSDEKLEATAATIKKIGIDAALINTLQFGGVTVNNHPAMIIDSENLKLKLLGIFTIVNIEGIIGWNVLQKLGMTIDYKTNQMEFYNGKANPKNHLGNNMFWLGYPVIKLNSADGQKLLFGLDTGARLSNINDKIIDRLNLQYQEEEIELGSAGGFVTVPSKKVDSLNVFLSFHKSILFKDIYTHPLEPATIIKLDGLIGSELFEDSIVEIDFPNNYFDVRN